MSKDHVDMSMSNEIIDTSLVQYVVDLLFPNNNSIDND